MTEPQQITQASDAGERGLEVWPLSVVEKATDAIKCIELEEKDLTDLESAKAERLAWLLPQCRKAIKEMKYFWQNKAFYSRHPRPQYLRAYLLVFSDHSSQYCP